MKVDLPQEFFSAQDELARFCSAQLSRSTLLCSESEILRAKEVIPDGLLPFMTIEEPSWPDIYAFDLSISPAAVVVWTDHAIVKRWQDFDSFLSWIRAKANVTDDKKC
jgi:hypothetical protein